ncbi:Ig-like domain-containing protein [Streptomyces sp. MnatMP-M17]|uniref:Ig-like domain-containing protein n=1 Tax=unclassified Streptomyces TaxID=2593676 RepID=UPI00081E9F26|nr:Ig-like domain-containing protein [Streptomyces sp. MnatMP-M17]SCF79207.1 WxL domain surface cell wall-binding [Streptomyces sp. MnatMP-M17]
MFSQRSVSSRRSVRAFAATAVTAVAVFAAGLVVAPSAQAAEIGTIDINPKTGTDESGIDFATSGACPDTASYVIVSVKGSGFPAEGQNVVGNAPIETYNTTAAGGMLIPLSSTMRDYANIAGFSTLQGEYAFTVTCRTAFNGTSLGDFNGSIWFTSNTAYQANDPDVKVDTTTALAVSPSGTTEQGDQVTLTATVAPAGAAGTVQFRDGAAALGSPVAVTGGTATLTTTNLAAGSHSLTAEFTPSSGSYNASVSTAVTHQVNAAAAKPTTTALAVSPADTAEQFSPVSLTATVTPAGAAGSVKFTDTVGGTATTLGTVPVTGGQAALTTSSLAPGDHSFTATFVPQNSAAYLASDSGNVPFKIGAFEGVSTSEDITTTVESGALVISVEDPHVTLPSPQLDANGELLTTAGALNPVTLTDTRAGNPGWTVSGQVTDFSDGATHTINGQNLGWTPSVIDHVSGQTVTAGAQVGAAAGAEPADNGTAGLKSSHTLANGKGLGTSHLGAALNLNVPTSTVAGTYTATLTLTAI